MKIDTSKHALVDFITKVKIYLAREASDTYYLFKHNYVKIFIIIINVKCPN